LSTSVGTLPSGARPVVRAVQFVLAHVPDLVTAGSKPRRELLREGPGLRRKIHDHLRTFDAAVAYAPHQVMIGNLSPESLWDRPRPWHMTPVGGASPEGPGGCLIDQSTFWAWLARADAARLVTFAEAFVAGLAPGLSGFNVRTAPQSALEATVAAGGEPLYTEGERLVGVMASGHEADESLTGAVLLENAAAKVTGALALRRLLDRGGPEPVDFLLGSGEEAVGDRYQRGGGNLARAMAELAEVRGAGGADVKAFCAGPVHALIMAGALVQSGLYRRVIVVAGGSLAKIGMKFLGHLNAGYPVLEDVLAGVAIEVVPDDGVSPWLRLDTAATLGLGDGDAPHQVATALTTAPLRRCGLRLSDVDRFAVELHNPDITEPAGSGDVPANNYRIIAALAAQTGEIGRDGMAGFVRSRGLPGFSPTQGHIASAVPYLPHALAGLTSGGQRRIQLVAKGSLFLGRMTTMGDGASVVLERNGGT
jgi:glycine/sarcosine/betaine reductase complex component C subunit beta